MFEKRAQPDEKKKNESKKTKKEKNGFMEFSIKI